MYLFVYLSVCVCVCVLEREREIEGKRGSQRVREKGGGDGRIMDGELAACLIPGISD